MKKKGLEAFTRDESGQDLVEYALLVGILAVGAVVAVRGLSNTYASVPDYLLNKLVNSW